MKNYNQFCKEKNCPEYIEWEFGEGVCISCQKVGQSHDIDKYPEDCLFIDEIKLVEVEQ